MNRLTVDSVMHDELASSHLAELRRLFDDENRDDLAEGDLGLWDG